MTHPSQVSLLASTELKEGKRHEVKKSFSQKLMSFFVPTNTDSTSLAPTKARRLQAEQTNLRKKQAEVATKVAQVAKFTPILKLENGVYTRDEWTCIIQHSQIKSLEEGVYMQSEHLSKNRLRQSLIYGLEAIDC